MIIECPHCLTRFRLDPKDLTDSRSMLKCTRCRRVFPAPGQPPPARARTAPPARERNLSFSFDDDDEWRAPELTPEHLPEDQLLLNVPEGGDEAGAAPPAARPAGALSTPAAAGAGADLLRYDDELDPDDEPAAEDGARRRGGGISVRPVFVFLVLVVCAYGALTWTLLDDPDWAERLTRTLPMIGREVRERAVGQDVSLIGVQGRYQRTKEGRLVFVITGKAVNHSGESLRGVQIVSKLYGPADRTLDEQIIACGNPMEARIGDLSIHQVAILRGIKPPPEFSVQPGGQCPFVGIFLEPSSSVAAFSTEVARAQRQT
jgi:predicted Zn finger-like uncharacterized protein